MVTFIIVNYNCGDLLRACVASLRSRVCAPFEIIVVDNDSRDNSLEALPSDVRVLRQRQNLGFSKACNIGARAANGSVFHFLNPDAEVGADINEAYARVFAASESAIYVTPIVDHEGRRQKTNYVLPNFSNVVKMFMRSQDVQYWYLGASVIVPRDLFWRLGGLSEDYFVYGDDIDFFYKAYLAHVPTVVLEAEVMHHSGGSAKKVWDHRQRLKRVERAASIFSYKFGLGWDYFVFRHLAFARGVWRDPAGAAFELFLYYRERLELRGRKPEARWNV